MLYATYTHVLDAKNDSKLGFYVGNRKHFVNNGFYKAPCAIFFKKNKKFSSVSPPSSRAFVSQLSRLVIETARLGLRNY